MKNLRFLAVVVPAVGLLLSCNAYRPFNSKGSANDYIQEAQKCLHEGDYSCAITNYSALPDGSQKEEKLCLAYLAQGGITISAINDIMKANTAKMLGQLAQVLVPYTTEKETAMDNALTHCDSLYNLDTTVAKAVLLRVFSKYSHCAIRIARTDLYVAASQSETRDSGCTTAGNGDGLIREGDISDAADGSFTSRGMCRTDALTCSTDISVISDGSLVNAGFSEFETAFDQIDSVLRGGSTDANNVRGALYRSVPAN